MVPKGAEWWRCQQAGKLWERDKVTLSITLAFIGLDCTLNSQVIGHSHLVIVTESDLAFASKSSVCGEQNTKRDLNKYLLYARHSGRCFYFSQYPHFTEEETEAQRLSNLSKFKPVSVFYSLVSCVSQCLRCDLSWILTLIGWSFSGRWENHQ